MTPELRLLLQLRLRGRASRADLEGGRHADDRATPLDDAAARGLVVERPGRQGGWVLTARGREELAAGLAADLDARGARDAVSTVYDRFRAVNPVFLGLCTRWQLRPVGDGHEVNDHTDAGYDWEVIAALDELHPTTSAICADLSRTLDRFAGYGPRFDTALERVHLGGTEWFDSPRVDSYHSVWFELHENLLATLGLERATEAQGVGGGTPTVRLGAMTPEETVDEFVRRICALDLDGACELVADDVEYDNVPMGKNFGPQGIKDLLGPMVGGLDGMDWVVHRQTATGNVVMNERTDRFRVGDEWIGLPVAGVFEVDDDGRIRLWRDYFDMGGLTELMAELGG